MYTPTGTLAIIMNMHERWVRHEVNNKGKDKNKAVRELSEGGLHTDISTQGSKMEESGTTPRVCNITNEVCIWVDDWQVHESQWTNIQLKFLTTLEHAFKCQK